jgi:DNA-binding NarL/FixJ family response regulator
MIRVLLADDQALVREGFRALIDREDDMCVIGEASDGAMAVRLALEHHPDVVLMDIRMPGIDGLLATATLLADAPDTRVLILTTFDHDDYLYQALRAGASGFLLKDVRRAQLIDGIRTVAVGDALLAPAITRRLIQSYCRRPPPAITDPASPIRSLTDRETTILQLIAAGMSNTEIGNRLFLSESTIKTHVGRIFAKIQARDRVQAVVIAYETGLVEPGGDAPRQP